MKKIFYMALFFLLLSCTTLSRRYEKNNIIIALDNQNTNNLEFVTVLHFKTRTHLTYDDLIIQATNEIADKGFHDVIIIPKLIDYKEIGTSNSYTDYDSHGRASAMDAFNAVGNAALLILESVKKYYYLIDFYIYKQKEDKINNYNPPPLFYDVQKKAENGNAEAQYNLALMYYEGKSIPVNKQLAFYWFKKAAEQENVVAQYNLVFMYYYGEGTVIDEKQAAYWAKKAYNNGSEKAKEFWDECELWRYQD